jgi:hypothetical protein
MNNAAFFGTIEFLSGQKAAIVTLTDSSGEWSGSGRIETSCGSICGHSVKESLYELGYKYLSLSASAKGGRLETYREVRGD